MDQRPREPAANDGVRGRSSPGPGVSRRALLAWVLYDWASNAYATLILTFVFAAYFVQAVAEDTTRGSVQWTVTLGITGAAVGLGAPILGAIVDHTGRRKPWLALFTLLCVTATAMLWFVEPDPRYLVLALVLIAVGELAMEYALVMYNAMLPHLVSQQHIGRLSGWGWSMGYAGGLGCLVVALVLLIEPPVPLFELDGEQAEPIRATFLLAAA